MADKQRKPLIARGFPLFTIFGFEVKLNLTWLLLALLITWTLAEGFFPERYPDLGTQTRWWMGIAGALGILFSIVFHELSHSLVARYYGLRMGGITLFVFGGVAEMRHEPKEPKVELLMAGAGPLSSLVLAGICWVLHLGGEGAGLPTPVTGVLFYLAVINVALAVFNLIPAYPLDGGRMLRAALWAWRDDIRDATRIASNMGSGFGLILIFLGVLSLIQGFFVGGMWYVLIGLFVRGAAKGSYRQLIIQQLLEGRSARDVMNTDPVTVDRSLSLRDFVDDYVYRYRSRMFPVVQGGELKGCATVERVKEVPEEQWEQTAIADIVSSCSDENTVSPDEELTDLASSLFGGSAGHQRLVVEDGQLLGVVSVDDLRELLQLRLELGDEAEPPANRRRT
ncbi:MAG TPA: site-2 protease family protein [Woeseiaceae bacterium]|nr:site-2 protease family protein [Woeseiaceae bacterium]